MSGNTDDMPFDFMGEKAFLAKTLTPKGRADGGVGNIVYKKDRVSLNRITIEPGVWPGQA